MALAFEPKSQAVDVFSPVGMVFWPLAAADSALYAAKGEGKNRVVVSAESIAT